MGTRNIITKIMVTISVFFSLYGLNNHKSTLTSFAMVGSGYAEHSQFYRLYSAVFIHANLTHLIFNMLALYQLGSIIEMRLANKVKYLIFILLSTTCSSLASWLFMPTYGASVGISGLVFALLGYFYLIHKEYNVPSLWINIILLFNLTLPFFIKAIDFRAHLGGLIFGLLYGWLIKSRKIGS